MQARPKPNEKGELVLTGISESHPSVTGRLDYLVLPECSCCGAIQTWGFQNLPDDWLNKRLEVRVRLLDEEE